jgi:hypothetical protein
MVARMMDLLWSAIDRGPDSKRTYHANLLKFARVRRVIGSCRRSILFDQGRTIFTLEEVGPRARL